MYVFENHVYEVDLVLRDEYDESEIFLIDPDTREATSIHDLPEYAQDDLWAACSDLMIEEQSSKLDWQYEMMKDQLGDE
jgi:hypothetical protein